MTAISQPTGEGLAGPDRARGALLDIKETSALLGCSKRTVYRLSDGGRMPRPIKLGALVRWRADELARWIDAGCPIAHPARKGDPR